MERTRTLDTLESKHAIRHSNGTDNPQLKAFDYGSFFTFFDDLRKQRLPETKQPHFRITKFHTFHCGASVCITNSQFLFSALKEKAVC